MSNNDAPLGLRIYTAVLAAFLLVIVILFASDPSDYAKDIGPWLFLCALLGLTEHADLSFHDHRGRWGLSAAEAIFMPMVVGFTFAQAVVGAVAAVGIVQVVRYARGDTLKAAFNVAQYGCAAAAAAALWSVLGTQHGVFTVRNAAAALTSVLVFAILTHLFVAGAKASAGLGSFLRLLREVGPAALWNTAGNMTLGLFFVASFLSGHWTVVLFPLALAALYLGYRAVLRQSGERERVEHLHAASRALAAGHNLEDAVAGFMGAMREIVSAAEARVILSVNKQWFVSSYREGAVTMMQPLTAGPLMTLMERLRGSRQALVVSQEAAADVTLAQSLSANSLIAVPLMNNDEFAGCLVALDRVGAEEFSDSDTRLLEALGNELVLTLDSYRLFAQVEEERERFQQIFAGSKEGICLLDEDGVIRAWNPAVARITGFEEEDILGEKWSERVLVRDRYHRRIEGMDIITVPPDEELELVTRQGPPRWVSIMSGEVQAEDTKSWVILVRDITREHELEESKSDFLATISHELRTPLTTIKGSLQVLSRPTASANSEIGTQMIEIMKRGSDRLERLVMNLLAVSQMEAGNVQVYPDEVALEELVRARISSILVDHPEVDVVADEDVVVRADRERLSQAVEHLLDNARKFGPESGPIHVEIVKENGFARLSITDEGPGIPKIDQERIFDRFVRLGHVLTRETQGPGIGLFIAKHSIEAMGGSIQVESDPNSGATFHVRVPLAHPMAAIEPASSA